MLANYLKNESGYSLVEVMASITILAIAIIPMVSMFDMGLNAATRGSNYDKARAFANERLERAKVLPYRQVRDNFPVPSSFDTNGTSISSDLDVPEDAGLPDGSTYTITKQYVSLNPDTSSFEDATTDRWILRVTVTVDWNSGSSITASGVVARGLR